MLLVGAAVLSRCTSHPVGPARTFAKYEGKATTTAASALSAVESTRLAAQTAGKGKALGPYTSVLVSEQEETLGGLQSTFDSIQPPDERADALRDELDQLLSDAGTHVAAVRIAARRGTLRGLETVAAPLDEDAKKLTAFQDQHQ